jgi:enolase
MMPDFTISKIRSRWILDSRGNPTVETDVYSGEKFARAAVPSGASTGSNEALELRDGGSDFLGKGVKKAVSNVNEILANKLIGFDVREQKKLDEEMINLDGTENKSKLGANAILSVSLAAAKLAAKLQAKPLFAYLYELIYRKSTESYLLPIPMSNILNGGKHAGNALSIQEFMVLPISAASFEQSMQMLIETYHTMKDLIVKNYGKSSTSIGDEGGFAPSMQNTTEALDIIVEAINRSGFTLGIDFVLGIDAAASEFYKEGAYHIDGKVLDTNEMIGYYIDLVEEYPIKLIEDPFEENAFDAFRKLTKNVNNNILIVDDDITVTNVNLLDKAIKMEAGSALLLKVNQIGTLTEAINAAKMAFSNDFNVIVSHRSGETEDTFISDLAVGLCTGLIKTGAPCRTDRNAKYNQLLRIEGYYPNIVKYPKSFDDWKKFQ